MDKLLKNPALKGSLRFAFGNAKRNPVAYYSTSLPEIDIYRHDKAEWEEQILDNVQKEANLAPKSKFLVIKEVSSSVKEMKEYILCHLQAERLMVK